MRLHGVDAELLDRDAVRAKLPFLDFDNARFPIKGALMQPRGGTVRHDAVAWGYARGADRHGVDIIQNCEVTAIRRENGRIAGVETTRGFIGAGKLALATAGHSSATAAMVDMVLPLESHVLQSDKGGLVFGGDIDGYNSYAQRGNLATVEHVAEAGVAMIPGLSRVRVLRSWGGVMDMSMDGSPIIDRTPIDNLYLNAGWCYGGFKATPASGFCFAHLIARNEPHETARAFRLDRFRRGHAIDEKGQGAQPNLH
jgi:sarcosine oxidase subunit beta